VHITSYTDASNISSTFFLDHNNATFHHHSSLRYCFYYYLLNVIVSDGFVTDKEAQILMLE